MAFNVLDMIQGSLGNRLSGGGSSSMIAIGSKLLSDFMGEKNTGALGGALASNLGISKESSGLLLGIAAPMLMSMLAGRKRYPGGCHGRCRRCCQIGARGGT